MTCCFEWHDTCVARTRLDSFIKVFFLGFSLELSSYKNAIALLNDLLTYNSSFVLSEFIFL